jgi:hypothetical protein
MYEIKLNKCLYEIYSELNLEDPFEYNSSYYLIGEDDTIIQFRIVANTYNVYLVEFNNKKAGKPPHTLANSTLFKQNNRELDYNSLNKNLTYQYIDGADLEQYIFGLKKLEYIWSSKI